MFTQISLIPDVVDHQNYQLISKPGTCKLTPEDVKTIRAKVASGSSQYSQAKKYDVSQATISDIVNFKIWRNLK